MENQVIKCLKERRSIKKYDSEKKVGDEELEAILEAGTYAPTGKNRQSPLIVAVRNEATVRKLSEMNAKILGSASDPFYGAPCVVVVFADSSINTALEDASLVMGNMLNAAHSLGLGGCWIHRAKEMFETEEGKELMREWGVDERFVGVGNCVLGYRSGDMPTLRPRKDGYVIKID